MKSLLLLLLVAATALCPVQAQPTSSAHKKPPAKTTAMDALPAEVRAYLPAGATSLYVGKQPMGIGGKPVLVHLWAAGRKTSPGYQHQFEPSPFCVDLFVLGTKSSGTPGKWLRIASTVYLGEDGPRDSKDVSVRWLYLALKRAPVLIIVSPSYISTRFTVITYPQNISDSCSYVQNFYQGGLGGGKTIYDFGTDKRGIMTVLKKSWYQNGPISTTVLPWNGHEYARPTAK